MEPLSAATATPAPGGLPWWAWPLLACAVALIWKVAEWRWRPWAPCRCCKGNGKHHRKDGKAFRDCWWCKGTGRRMRVGRRIWNRFAKLRKASA